MRYAIAHKFYIGMSWENGPEYIAESVILIVEDIGGASLIILFL